MSPPRLRENDLNHTIAAMCLAGILAALIRTGRLLRDEKILIAGDHPAGHALLKLLSALLQKQSFSETESLRHIFLLPGNHRESLLHQVKIFKPATLIGLSGKTGFFTQEILMQMGQNTPCPIIFPLSSPARQAESTPSEIYQATNGRAMICTSDVFPPLEIKSTDMDENRPTTRKVFFSAILPEIVLDSFYDSAESCKIPTLSKEMFLAAALKIAQSSPNKISKEKGILPNITEIRAAISKALTEQAQKKTL